MDDFPTNPLETARLILRPWRVSEADVWHQLWTERDPRVPPHRRIGADRRPTVEDIEQWIRTGSYARGLLAVERNGKAIGYCGLVDYKNGERQLAFEFLQSTWRQGYATEASWAVIDRARSIGCQRLWATVWDWNVASRRVLEKLGFTEVKSREVKSSEVPGTSLLTTKEL